MAEVIPFQIIPIVAAGLSLSLDVTQYVPEYLITTSGAITLTGSVTITPTGTPAVGTVLVFKYEGNILQNTSTITIFGRVINIYESINYGVITSRWDDISGVWITDFEMSDNGKYVGKVLADSTDALPDILENKITDSIVADVIHTIHLDGDVASPADKTHYGKQSGAKGWFADYVPLLPVGTVIYLGLLTQTGTNAPVPTVGVNTLGVTVGGTYATVGVYKLNLPSTAVQSNTFIFTGTGLNDSNFVKSNFISPGGNPAVEINTYDKTGTLSDGLLLGMPILIIMLP